jgi:asparagine synthase (glutamine-hydrolysing)
MFASEIKALLMIDDLPRTANPRSTFDYLANGVCDHGEETMFAHVHQVPVAGVLTLDVRDVPRVIARRIAWVPTAASTIDVSRDDAARLVREAFLGNIGRHLRSDVPVGAALSGGLDSSSILAAMRLVEPKAELHAFSYLADDSLLNEERWVRAAATAARAEVHSAHVSADSLAKDVDALIYAQDEPFSGTTVYAQYSVFRAVHAAGIRVVLDGQGADELLGGYATYLGPHMAHLVARRAWGALTQLVRSSHGRTDVSMMTAARYAVGASTPAWVKRRLRRHVRTALFPAWLDGQWFRTHGVTADLHEPDPGPHLRSHLVTSLRSFLPSLLRYEDRNSMAFSVESRVPFLTTRFADLVLSLPDDYLISPDGARKAVFRDAMRGIVPDLVIERRDKLGFHTPEPALLGAGHSWATHVLESEAARRLPGLRPDTLQQAAAVSRNGTHGPKIPLWRILNLIRWADIFDVQFAE